MLNYSNALQESMFPDLGDVSSVSYDKATTPKEDRTKKPMNPFMLWAKFERRKMRAEFPNVHNTEISKRLGKVWKLLSDAEKRPFVVEARKQSAEHLRLYPDYKCKPRRKPRRKDRSLPGNLRTSVADSSSWPNAVTLKAEPYAHFNGWLNDPYALMHQQLGYMQHNGLNISPFTPLHEHEVKNLHYNSLMPPAQGYPNSAMYNVAAPYIQQRTPVMGEAMVSGENAPSSSPLSETSPQSESSFSDVMSSTYTPVGGDERPQSLRNEKRHTIHHFPSVRSEENGQAFLADLQ